MSTRARLLLLLLTLVLALSATTIMAQDETETPSLLPDLAGREITIAVENAYPPYNYIDENSDAVGWDYDTFRDICHLLNCTPVFEEMAWDGMLIAISNGEADVAADGITYTEERDQSVDFSTLYQAYDETLLVRESEDRFTTADELKAVSGFRVATQVGTTNEITAQELFGQDNVQSYDTFGAAIEALLNDDVDAVVVDRPAAEGYITARGSMKTLSESLKGTEGLAFAFPSGSDLVEPINAAMAELQTSGRWDQIYTRWFEQPDLPDLEGREVTIAVENAYPPYNYIDESGDAVGWDYDTFNAICKRINCTPVFEEMAWDGMLIGVSNGEVDIAADGITYTPERDESVDFSSLYQAYDETLLVRESEDRFTSADELKALPDYRVATQVGTTNEITAHDLFGQDNVQSYDTFGAAIEALLNDDVDAVVVDRPAAEGYITARGNMKTLAESLAGIEGLAFAFPTGSDLVEPVDAAMAALEADGTWDDIYSKWFESSDAS